MFESDMSDLLIKTYFYFKAPSFPGRASGTALEYMKASDNHVGVWEKRVMSE